MNKYYNGSNYSKLYEVEPKNAKNQPSTTKKPPISKLLARHGQPATPVPPDRPSEKEIGRKNGRFWQKDSSSCVGSGGVQVGMGWILASRDGISTDHIESTRTWRGRYVDRLFATICHFDILNSIIINLSCCLREHL